METALTFNEVSFTPVTHQNSLWIRAVELARALGYKDESSVRRIYERNADEFSSDMTQVIEMSEAVNLTVSSGGGNSNSGSGHIPGLCVKARIFSLRGCHLLAMFARTPVAKAFRKWVLDVLDKVAAEERAGLPHVPHIQITPSTPASRKPLEKLVKVWARQGGLIHAQCWTMLNAAFNLQCISDLPEEWIPDAITWVQSKIDALPKALPSAEPDYTLTPAQAKFMPSDLPSFVKEMETTINSMTYLVNRMEISGHPSGLTWGQLSRNKPLYEAITENIQSARAACVAGLRMLKSVKLICTGVR